tara:strand:- start:1023 stop:1319 length:297 start_codon:yes stop_codon:yes gene_type:complete
MNNEQLISEVTDRLSDYFDTERIKIVDDSKHHVGHSGNTGGAHLTLEIVSVDFEKLSRIERHKLIYECLDGFIPVKIHALKVLAMSPLEFKAVVQQKL